MRMRSLANPRRHLRVVPPKRIPDPHKRIAPSVPGRPHHIPQEDTKDRVGGTARHPRRHHTLFATWSHRPTVPPSDIGSTATAPPLPEPPRPPSGGAGKTSCFCGYPTPNPPQKSNRRNTTLSAWMRTLPAGGWVIQMGSARMQNRPHPLVPRGTLNRCVFAVPKRFVRVVDAAVHNRIFSHIFSNSSVTPTTYSR